MTCIMNVLTFLCTVATLPMQLMEAVGLYKLYKRIVPRLLWNMSASYNRKMNDKKRELFRNLTEFNRPREPLRILEIGCGTGANFKFYPSSSKVVCTDPNPYLHKYLEKSMAENDHLSYEMFVVASGHDLRSIEDESVDVIVATLVLCSVKNIQSTLKEAQRMLRPGGAFFFLEHVVADPSSWTYFFQHVLQPVWYYFGDGCVLTRATWKHLEAAGFSDLKLQHINAPLFALLKPHVLGYAIK